MKIVIIINYDHHYLLAWPAGILLVRCRVCRHACGVATSAKAIIHRSIDPGPLTLSCLDLLHALIRYDPRGLLLIAS
jgi:hypothetical protein